MCPLLIDDECYRTSTRFVWLNPRGGYDAFTFTSPRSLKSKIKKTGHKQSLPFPRVLGDREDVTLHVDPKDRVTTSTNKVSAEVAEWLQELLESPEVFIEHPQGRIPVTINNNNSAIVDTYNNSFNIKVEYSHAFTKVAIRA